MRVDEALEKVGAVARNADRPRVGDEAAEGHGGWQAGVSTVVEEEWAVAARDVDGAAQGEAGIGQRVPVLLRGTQGA